MGTEPGPEKLSRPAKRIRPLQRRPRKIAVLSTGTSFAEMLFMLVKASMTRDVIVVSPEQSVEKAWAIMRGRGIRHLPVAINRELVGIVSDRDLLRMGDRLPSGEMLFWDRPVSDVMTRNLITCSPKTSIAEAARIMTDRKIDALPVVAGGVLVGLVTSTDLLLLLVDQAPMLSLPFDWRISEAVA